MTKHKYYYSGPVLYFDKILTNKWEGTTVATSKKKAISNLSYQIKKQSNLPKTAKIILIEKYLRKLEAVM